MESEELFQDELNYSEEVCHNVIVTEEPNEVVVTNENDHEEIPLIISENQIEIPTTENNVENKNSTNEKENRLTQLPLSKIRNIIKLDPDLNIISNEAVFAVTKATELFIESLARESFLYTKQAKKKIIQKRDVDLAISSVDSLMFLDGAMNF